MSLPIPKTLVINVKVSFLRSCTPIYNNLKEWIEADPQNHVYIGRPGVVFVDGQRYPPAKFESSKLFCNPFKIEKGATRDEVVERYRKYALERMRIDKNFRTLVFSLKGKKLGCWCKPEACHGDVLREICERMSEEDFLIEQEARRRDREEEEEEK